MTLTLLAINDVSLPLRKNVCLYLAKPFGIYRNLSTGNDRLR